MLAIAAFAVSILNVIIDYAAGLIDISHATLWECCVFAFGKLLLLVLAVCFSLITLNKILKYKSVGKWRKYIIGVLEDMEEEVLTWK